MSLTDMACRQARFQGKPYKLADSGGLYLLVDVSGKYWRWKYRFEKKEKVMALGVYPEVTLSEARHAHQAGRKLLATGADPMVERKAQKKAGRTFEEVSRQWHAHWAPDKSPGHAAQTLRRLELDVFPEIGKKAVAELTASAFRDMAQKVENRGALDIARRALQTCGQIMRYAVANDLAERNPVADVRPADVLKPRKKRNYPRIGAKELPDLLRAIDGYAGSEHTVLALKLMVLTFVRTGELIGATWKEFDLEAKRWNIPAERMKMDSPHIVPLSKQALAILEKLKSLSFGREYVFPADTGKSQPMSNNTILGALYRMGYKSRMTGHGFRGVASTILHEQDYPHEHIELQLAHAERDEVSAAYNHALYLKQRAEMMQWWADYLDQCVGQSKVIPLRTA